LIGAITVIEKCVAIKINAGEENIMNQISRSDAREGGRYFKAISGNIVEFEFGCRSYTSRGKIA
jgi:hypothetical protein